MDGNQALAYGLIAAGVRYGAGYPITPWSTVMEILRSELPKYGGLFVQAEDELAAVSLALGFSYSGYLSVTGSAGPGISLKTEAIGWASMAEIPLLVVNVQRGGPSTGLPTNVEQSDLYQAIFGSHGDSPRVVLAAANVEDCFYVALEAARIARKYSTPVFILSDSSLATRIEAFDEPDLKSIMQDPKPDLTPRSEGYKPYPVDGITKHAPPGTRMIGGKYPVVTGLEHDEMGHPTGRPALHMAMTAKRRRKLKQLAEEIPLPEVYGNPEGDTLIVGWGSTFGPIREAVDRAKDRGKAFHRCTCGICIPFQMVSTVSLPGSIESSSPHDRRRGSPCHRSDGDSPCPSVPGVSAGRVQCGLADRPRPDRSAESGGGDPARHRLLHPSQRRPEGPR